MKLNKVILFLILIILVGCSILDTENINPYLDQTEDNLDIIYIHPKPVSHDYYTPVTLIYKGIEYEAEGKIRGKGSALFPKKSYTIKFDDGDLFDDGSDYSKKKIVLASNFDDNSYIRNRLAFDLWSTLDTNFTINTDSKVVYLNGEYEGLYTLIDYIGEDFIEHNKTDLTSQNQYSLYKNLTYYEKKLGYPEEGSVGDDDDIEQFFDYINDDDNFNSNFEKYADAQNYYNWWFFVSFISAGDSVNGNSYHFHDLTDDGKWIYIPWDFNQSFGQDFSLLLVEPSAGDGLINGNIIFQKIVNNDYFSSQYSADYNSQLAGDWSLTNILAKINSFADEVEDAAQKDEDKWRADRKDFYEERSDFTTFDEEIIYMKEWITEQHALWSDKYSD